MADELPRFKVRFRVEVVHVFADGEDAQQHVLQLEVAALNAHDAARYVCEALERAANEYGSGRGALERAVNERGSRSDGS